MIVRNLHGIRRDIRGQSLAEFAIAAPILFLLLFGIVEFSRHYYARLGIRHAVAEAARFHATGQLHPNPDPEGQPFGRAGSIEHVIHRRAAELGLAVDGVRVFVVDGEDPEEGEENDGGAEGDLVRIEADLTFDFIAGPLLHILPGELESVGFTVATTYKNEPRF